MINFRLSLAANKEKINQEIGKVSLPNKYDPQYQIIPSQRVCCLLDINKERIFTLEWGLIPSMSRTLNNRGNLHSVCAKDIASKSSTRIPFRTKRGIVICDGIYFIKKDASKYTPYRIELKSRKLLRVACVWDEWKSDDTYFATTAIVQNATSNFPINFFPTILNEEMTEEWLTNYKIDSSLSLLNTQPNISDYNIYKVRDNILDSSYNQKDLLEPVREEINLFSQL